MKKKLPAPLWIALSLLLLAGAAYLSGVFYFETHFPFQTTFMGEDVSGKTPEVIDARMEAESRARSLTLLEMGGETETLHLASAIGYRRTAAAPEEGWIRQGQAWSWPKSLFEATELQAEETHTYSEERLRDALGSLRAMDPKNVTKPENAYVRWENGRCSIVPEIDGNMLEPEKLFDAVRAAIEAGVDSVDLEAAGCYYKAEVRQDDEELNAYVARYEAIDFQEITLDMTGVEITLSPDDVLALYDEEESAPDREKVAAYAAELKETYDTYERERPFTDHYGNEIMAGTWADTYGFKMDLEATTQLLMDTLESKETVTISPVWINEAWVREEDGSDIGDTYIEVSISEQRLWAYVDGEEILSTDVVTGNTGNHDTPRGVFRIMSKAQSTYLVGEGYRSYVDYWMQITRGGVGLHDASWRSTYGGNIYTYNGSHGCINMPLWAAESVYNAFTDGTPVVIW